MASKLTGKSRVKNIERLLDENEKVVKRFKALQTLFETSTDTETQELCEAYFDQILAVIDLMFADFEAVAQKTKKKKGTSNSVVEDIVKTSSFLRTFIVHAGPLLKNKHDSIDLVVGMVEQLVAQENRMDVRVQGVDIVLTLMLSAHGAEGDDIEELFSRIVPLVPFGGEALSFQLPITTANAIAASVPTPETTRSTIQLLTQVMDYITDVPPEHFDYFWTALRDRYLNVFYIREGGRGFKKTPADIQVCIVNYLHVWVKRDHMLPSFLCREVDSLLIRDILSNGLRLGEEQIETCLKSMAIFRVLTNYRVLPPKMDVPFDDLLQDIIGRVAEAFEVAEFSLDPNLMQLVLDALNLYRYIALEAYHYNSVETWECLLNRLLTITIDLVSNTSPEWTQHQAAQNYSLFVFETTFTAWIRSNQTDNRMWETLQSKAPLITRSAYSVVQWARLVLTMTSLLATEVFGVNLVQLANDGELKPTQSRFLDYISMSTLEIQRQLSTNNTLDPIAGAFPKIVDIAWEPHRVEVTWRRVVSMLGNINLIDDPLIFSESVRALSMVTDMLIALDDQLGRPVKGEHEGVAPLTDTPDLFRFSPWLFEACTLDNRYSTGRAMAYGALCRLVCRRHIVSPPLDPILLHFYRVVHSGLNLADSAAEREIFTNATGLFGLNFPGSTILIPDFVRAIKKLLEPGGVTPLLPVREDAISLLASMVCLPRHYAPASIPDLMDAAGGNPAQLDAAALTQEIADVVLSLVKYESHPNTLIMALWAVFLVICEELTSTMPREEIVGDCLKTVLSVVTHNNFQIARAAVDVLSNCTTFFEHMDALDPKNVTRIVKGVCNNIRFQVNENLTRTEPRLDVIELLLYCLLDWIMAAPASLLADDVKTSNEVFDTLEACLTNRIMNTDSVRASVFDRRRQGGAADISWDVLERMAINAEKDDVIASAAAAVLSHILVHLNSYPSDKGIEQITSHVTEFDDRGEDVAIQDLPCLFFVYRDKAIISCVENQIGDNRFARLILRDMCGKFCWSAKAQFEPEVLPEDACYPLGFNQVPVALAHNTADSDAAFEAKQKSLKPFERTTGDMPVFDNAVDTSQTDMLSACMSFIEETLPPEALVDVEAGADMKRIADAEDAMLSRYVDQRDMESGTLASVENPALEFGGVLIPLPAPYDDYTLSRMMLCQLGFAERNSLESTLRVLPRTDRLARNIKELDRISSRELLKIGVIYVAPFQEDQKSILMNEGGSPQYREFLSSLGWPVSLGEHTGYMGGLDRKLSTGTHAPYYANSQIEVMYHVVSLMPTNEKDPQQIHKKRHVGNDIVHIVWSEHDRDYSPDTIVSHFNDVHIMINPLSNGLYRVQVARKESMPQFGPCQNNYVLTRELVGPLVRMTAINANRYRRHMTEGYQRPFPTRLQLLSEIVGRYQEPAIRKKVFYSLVRPTESQEGDGAESGRSSATPASSAGDDGGDGAGGNSGA